MRFRKSPSRSPYLNTRDQMRMLGLIGLLVLVLIAMKVAAKPNTWAWMFPDEGPQTQKQSQPAPEPSKESMDFDIRLDEGETLPPGAFRSRGPVARPDRREGRGLVDSTPFADSGRATPVGGKEGNAFDPASQSANASESAEQSSESNVQGSLEHEIEVDPSLLAGIRDNTLGVRSDEADAYYALLAKIRDVPLRTLERFARDDVTFTVLMVESDHFRGKLVTLEGEVKRLTPLPPRSDQHDFEQLYEFWMLTPDSGTNPIRVVCTEVPKGMPQGETVEQAVRVRVTGYFFKREGYASKGGLHVAPLILAKRPRWFRPPVSAPVAGDLAPWLLGGLLLIASALGLTIWRLSARDRAVHRDHLRRLTEAPPEAIQALDRFEVTDPAETFRRLSEESQTGNDE